MFLLLFPDLGFAPCFVSSSPILVDQGCSAEAAPLPPCCISCSPPRGQQATLVFSFGYLKIVLLQVFPLYHGFDMHKFCFIPRSDLEEDPLFQTCFWLVVPDQLKGFFCFTLGLFLVFFLIPVGFIKFRGAGYEECGC